MIRKQLYIHKRHQLLLRRLAEKRGVSEAEVVRQAIEHEAAGAVRQPTSMDRAAWEEIVKIAQARKVLASDESPYRWDRRDAYQERDHRYDRPSE